MVDLVVEAQSRIGEVAILSLFSRTAKVSLLIDLRSLTSHLPHDPLANFLFAMSVLWSEPAGILGERHHNGDRFEDHDRRSAAERFVINDRGHPTFWESGTNG